MGWSTIKNGQLLTLAAEQFDVFVTVDRNLSYQQNLGAAGIVVIVLAAKSNRLAELRRLVPALLAAIVSARRCDGGGRMSPYPAPSAGPLSSTELPSGSRM